jgi:hypothetical protein
LGSGTCAACGQQADELNYSIAAGGVVCERCHCDAAPPTRARTPRFRSPKPPPRPEWVQHRFAIVDALIADGAFFYLGADHVAGRCPRCSMPLGVRFLGRTTDVDVTCHGGCDPVDVIRWLGRADGPGD